MTDRWLNTLTSIIVLFLFALMLRQCGPNDTTKVVIRERIDTVIVPVPRIEYYNVPGRTRIIYDTVLDEALVNRLSTHIDSLQRAMAKAGARKVFTLDTITPRGDTVFVECNETTKRITVIVDHAPVDTAIRRIDTLTITEHQAKYGLVPYIQAAATLSQNQVWSAQGNIGLRLNLDGQTSPFIDAQYHLLNGPLIRMGIEINF